MKLDPIEDMVANSYHNFHVRGLDYLCLRRSADLTVKVYFMEGDVSKMPEVVNPHDHRYDFDTIVLTGAMSNSYYEEDPLGKVFQQFEWDTPLNGGAGFTWKKETRLLESERKLLRVGEKYFMDISKLHTIRMHADTTVIMLKQYEDRVPLGSPTRTFTGEREAPDTSGLYDKMTEDHLIKRLGQWRELMNGI